MPPRPVCWNIPGVKIGRGKAVAVGTLVLGLAVLIAAFAIKDWAVAEYYLWKLKSGDILERKVAAAELSKTGSRTVPLLLRVIADDFDPQSPRAWCGNCRKVSKWYLASKALEEMGTAALPALHDALQDNSAGVRHAAAEAMKKIQGE